MTYSPAIAGALLAVCVAIAVLVATAALRRTSAPSRIDTFLRFVAVAAIASVGSSAMYMFYAETPSLVTLVVGDVAMMCGPAFVWVALRALAGDERRALLLVAVAGAIVATATVIMTLPQSIVVKCVALIFFCLLTVVATLRPPVRAHRSSLILTVVNAAYVVYTTGRLVSGGAGGVEEDAPSVAWFGTGAATVVGAVAVLATGVACVLMTRAVRSAPLAVDASVDMPAWRVSIPDYAFMPAAFGLAHARALEEALVSACREVDPSAAASGPGEAVVRGRRADVERTVQARFAALAAESRVAAYEPLRFDRA